MNASFRTTKKILGLLKVKYTTKYLKDTIVSHPDYNSLLSISDTLSKYNIESLALKIDWVKLKEVPLPAVVHVKENNIDQFYIIVSIVDGNVSCYNDQNKLINLSKEEFLEIWTGVSLLIEATEKSKEIDIDKKLTNKLTLDLLKGGIIILLISWMLISFLSSEIYTIGTSSIIYSILFVILKIVGLIIGGLLLWFEIEKFNPTLQKFCSGNSKKINCNSVLSSKYSKLFNGTLSLSMLAFSYFLGTLVYLLINNFSLTSLSVLSLISFATLPILVVSIYYQAIVIKQWCKFCVMIQAILLSEITINLLGKFYIYTAELKTFPQLFALFLIPILCWKLIKPLLEQKKETNSQKRYLKKIKNNPDVFKTLLFKSRKIERTTEGLGILINNANARYHLVKVCSPYCSPCAKAHLILEGLLNTGKINLQILFTGNSTKDEVGKVVSHFLVIDELDKNKTQQALDDWYLADQKDYEIFASKYPFSGELERQRYKIEAMYNWCYSERIAHTPTIFINGYELPQEYNLEDLRELLL